MESENADKCDITEQDENDISADMTICSSEVMALTSSQTPKPLTDPDPVPLPPDINPTSR